MASASAHVIGEEASNPACYPAYGAEAAGALFHVKHFSKTAVFFLAQRLFLWYKVHPVPFSTRTRDTAGIHVQV